MPRSIPLLALVAVLALAGCSSSNTEGVQIEQGQLRIPGGSGEEISATDVADVHSALQAIEGRCGGMQVPDQSVNAAVTTILQVTRREGRNGVYESGDSASALTMANVARNAATRLRTCGLPQQAARLRPAT